MLKALSTREKQRSGYRFNIPARATDCQCTPYVEDGEAPTSTRAVGPRRVFRFPDSNVFYVRRAMERNPPRRGLNIVARGRAESPGRWSAAPGTHGFRTVALKGPNKCRSPCFALSGLGFRRAPQPRAAARSRDSRADQPSVGARLGYYVWPLRGDAASHIENVRVSKVQLSRDVPKRAGEQSRLEN